MSWLEHKLAIFQPWLDDPAAVEISVNPDRSVWLLKRGDVHMQKTDVKVEPGFGHSLANRIAGENQAQTGREKLMVSAAVSYKDRPIRAQAVLAPATPTEAALSFRLFSSIPIEEIELKFLYGKQVTQSDKRRKRSEHLRSMTEGGDLMGALRYCVDQKMNILISGGTDTGKSVTLRKIISMIPQQERIITIEDARELYPTQPNTVALIADRAGKVRSTDMLLEATLRMRPDRLIVGEVRGKEAMTFLEAINTGHGGSMTTVHAESPELALDKLAIAAGKSGEVQMTYSDLRGYIERTIDVVIQTGREEHERGIQEVFIPEVGAAA